MPSYLRCSGNSASSISPQGIRYNGRMDTKKTRGNAQHPRKDGMAGGEGPWHRDDARTEGGSRGRKPQSDIYLIFINFLSSD